MSKTVRFSIEANEPNGTTFEDMPKAKFAGATNTKRKAKFGIMGNDPQGTTFVGNKSHISMPNANKAPAATKVETSKEGGAYKPAKSGPQNFGGSVPVGKSSPK